MCNNCGIREITNIEQEASRDHETWKQHVLLICIIRKEHTIWNDFSRLWNASHINHATAFLSYVYSPSSEPRNLRARDGQGESRPRMGRSRGFSQFLPAIVPVVPRVGYCRLFPNSSQFFIHLSFYSRHTTVRLNDRVVKNWKFNFFHHRTWLSYVHIIFRNVAM